MRKMEINRPQDFLISIKKSLRNMFFFIQPLPFYRLDRHRMRVGLYALRPAVLILMILSAIGAMAELCVIRITVIPL